MALDYDLYIHGRGIPNHEASPPSDNNLGSLDRLPSLLGVKSAGIVDLTASPREFNLDNETRLQASRVISFRIDPAMTDEHGLTGVSNVIDWTIRFLATIPDDAVLIANGDTIVYMRVLGGVVLNANWGWSDYRKKLLNLTYSERVINY